MRVNSVARRRLSSWVLWAVVGTVIQGRGLPWLYGQSGARMDEVYEEFQNPPAGYSMVPLVRINDAVNREELRWQMEQMREQGIEAAFLLPEWLGPSYGWKDA